MTCGENRTAAGNSLLLRISLVGDTRSKLISDRPGGGGSLVLDDLDAWHLHTQRAGGQRFDSNA